MYVRFSLNKCGKHFCSFQGMSVPRPSEENQRYAREMVNLSLPYLHRIEELDSDGSDLRLAQKIHWLLLIFNGNWRSTRLVHHCSLSCQCGCSSPSEVRYRAVAIYTGFVLGSRPPIPALSKWCKCGLTARWFLLGCGIHQLLQRGFDLLYGISSKSAWRSACEELGQELSSLVSGTRTCVVFVFFLWFLFRKGNLRIQQNHV